MTYRFGGREERPSLAGAAAARPRADTVVACDEQKGWEAKLTVWARERCMSRIGSLHTFPGDNEIENDGAEKEGFLVRRKKPFGPPGPVSREAVRRTCRPCRHAPDHFVGIAVPGKGRCTGRRISR